MVRITFVFCLSPGACPVELLPKLCRTCHGSVPNQRQSFPDADPNTSRSGPEADSKRTRTNGFFSRINQGFSRSVPEQRGAFPEGIKNFPEEKQFFPKKFYQRKSCSVLKFPDILLIILNFLYRCNP